MSVTPLETLYHGVYFRSRTEARFAVFLDCLGIKWEYEPQGFDLGNGLKYLPDFKIYNVSTYHMNGFKTYDYMYVEVKGMWDDKVGKLTKRDFEKIARFSFDESQNPIWVAGNTYTLDPRNDEYIKQGGSPRAGIALAKMAAAHAFLEGRKYCVPSDVQKVFKEVLIHRINLNTAAKGNELSKEEILDNILKRVEPPRVSRK